MKLRPSTTTLMMTSKMMMIKATAKHSCSQHNQQRFAAAKPIMSVRERVEAWKGDPLKCLNMTGTQIMLTPSLSKK